MLCFPRNVTKVELYEEIRERYFDQQLPSVDREMTRRKKLHISTQQSEKKTSETKMNSEHARAQLSSSEMRNSENIYPSFRLLLQLATGKTTRENVEKKSVALASPSDVIEMFSTVDESYEIIAHYCHHQLGPALKLYTIFSYSLARRTFLLIVVVGFTQQHQRTLHISHDLDIYCWHIIAQLHLALPPCVCCSQK